MRSSGPAANSSTMGQLRARRKAAKMLVAVVVMFAVCYFPVHLLNILRYELAGSYVKIANADNRIIVEWQNCRYTVAPDQSNTISVLSLISHWMCYANSAVNPVIYNFMSGKSVWGMGEQYIGR